MVNSRSVTLSSPPIDDIPIIDDADLGQLSSRESELLAESNDLEGWQRQRILAAARALVAGDMESLLSVGTQAAPSDLKRGYYQLSKLLHPDQYYGKALGSFGPIIERLFAAVCQLVKTATDSRSVASPVSHSGPKRRHSERYPFRIGVTVGGLGRGFRVYETADLGPGGVFVAGQRLADRAEVGQAVQLLLHPERQRSLVANAVVAWIRPPRRAEAVDLPVGVGMRFESVNPKDAGEFERLIASLRQLAPPAAIETEATSEPAAAPPSRRIARGSCYHPVQGRTVGIDVGTTHLSVSALCDGAVRVLPWPDGSLSVPSVLAFPQHGEPLVGRAAHDLIARDPRLVVASIKRLLGRKASDPDVVSFLARASYRHSAGPQGLPVIEMWGQPLAVTQLFGYLLKAARDNAERVLGARVGSAVVSIPVSFTAERIAEVRQAARMAQLEIVEIIEEPSAAAIACHQLEPLEGLAGVFDFGGGTFDFSVVASHGGDLEILATAGDSWLGGDDFDQRVAEAAAEVFWRSYGIDLRHRLVEWHNLLRAAEQAKRQLTDEAATQVVVPGVAHRPEGPVDLRMRLSRNSVEPIWAPLVNRAIDTCLTALASIHRRPDELSAIYLSGGTSYVPAVRRALAHRFPVAIRTSANPELAVCLGSGLRAAKLEARRRVAAPVLRLP